MQIHAQCISSVWVCLNNCTILGKVLYSANTVFSWILKISTGFMCYTCRQLGKKILINEIQEGQHPLTACHQFQATGHPVSRTQASDAMTSRLPRYEAKSVQRRCFQWGSVPLRSDNKGTELPPANILIPLERQVCRWLFLYNETLQQTSPPLLSKLVWKTTNLGIWSPFWGS